MKPIVDRCINRWRLILAILGFAFCNLSSAIAAPQSPSAAAPTLKSTPQSAQARRSATDGHSGSNGVNATSQRKVNASPRWQYFERRDEMRNASTKSACISSSNKLEFHFPYNGGSRSRICLRDSPRFGLDAYLTIDKGQFMCGMDCTIKVKFDDGEIQTLTVNEPSDGSTGLIFLDQPDSFIASTLAARRIVVEAGFFQEGLRQIVFEDVQGLEWPRP